MLTSDITGALTHAAVRGDYYMLTTRLQVTKHSFYYHGIMTWNGIPIEARLAESINVLKKWMEILYF